MTALEKIYKEAAEKLDTMHGELKVQLVFVEKLAEILKDSDNNIFNECINSKRKKITNPLYLLNRQSL